MLLKAMMASLAERCISKLNGLYESVARHDTHELADRIDAAIHKNEHHFKNAQSLKHGKAQDYLENNIETLKHYRKDIDPKELLLKYHGDRFSNLFKNKKDNPEGYSEIEQAMRHFHPDLHSHYRSGVEQIKKHLGTTGGHLEDPEEFLPDDYKKHSKKVLSANRRIHDAENRREKAPSDSFLRSTEELKALPKKLRKAKKPSKPSLPSRSILKTTRKSKVLPTEVST